MTIRDLQKFCENFAPDTCIDMKDGSELFVHYGCPFPHQELVVVIVNQFNVEEWDGELSWENKRELYAICRHKLMDVADERTAIGMIMEIIRTYIEGQTKR